MTSRSANALTVGLGLRRPLMAEMESSPPDALDFIELAPENWIPWQGGWRERFDRLAQHYPVFCHGLSLSLGGPDPLDWLLLKAIGDFLDQYRVPIYSEHLSFCAAGGQLYDLLPLPFTDEAILHTARRIRQVQDFLGRRIAVENVSYYAAWPENALSEVEFIRAVLGEADCDLLLDVNNVYVNAVNHGYDPVAFIRAMPATRVAYLHIAGHHRRRPDLIIDTHAAAVIQPVWALLDHALAHCGPRPVLLERDDAFPALSALLREIAVIRRCVTGRMSAETADD